MSTVEHINDILNADSKPKLQAYNPNYLRQIIATTLKLMDMYSSVAAELLLLTAAHESHLGKFLCQNGSGPALGLYQMEPATLHDIYVNYLNHRPERGGMVERLTGISVPSMAHLQHDPIYSTVMARLHYRRVSDPFPQPGDLNGLAEYAKEHFNTPLGKATVEKYIDDYQQLVVG